MKKQTLRLVAALGLFAVVAILPAGAQAPNGLLANIPFKFTIENQQLPAGEYRIQAIQAGRLLFRRTDGTLATTVLTVPVKGNAIESHGKLLFHRYGDQYFLAQFWAPNQNIGRELLESRVEAELAKRQEHHEVAVKIGSYAAPAR